jgi:LAS superfamily LD-carboxypeptidase LdcB
LNAKSSEFAPPTAKPHYSKHECGVAVDLNTKGDGQLQWLKNNASKYGFRQTIPSEAWHFEFFG